MPIMIQLTHMNARPMMVGIFTIIAVTLSFTPAYATISCAGYLPSSYFERIENNKPFAGKLIELTNGTQQLHDLNGNILTDNLSDAYIVMDKHVLAQQNGKSSILISKRVSLGLLMIKVK